MKFDSCRLYMVGSRRISHLDCVSFTVCQTNDFQMRIPSNARVIFGMTILFCIVYLLHRYGFGSLSTNTFYANHFSEQAVVSEHWLIIDSMTQLEQYRRLPLQKKSIVLTGVADHTGALNQTDVISVNSEKLRRDGFKTKNTKMLAYLLAIQHGARFIYCNNPSITFHNDTRHIAFRQYSGDIHSQLQSVFAWPSQRRTPQYDTRRMEFHTYS